MKVSNLILSFSVVDLGTELTHSTVRPHERTVLKRKKSGILACSPQEISDVSLKHCLIVRSRNHDTQCGRDKATAANALGSKS